jgi:hypothetical protein
MRDRLRLPAAPFHPCESAVVLIAVETKGPRSTVLALGTVRKSLHSTVPVVQPDVRRRASASRQTVIAYEDDSSLPVS